MNTLNQIKPIAGNLSRAERFADRATANPIVAKCLSSCQKLLGLIEKTKNNILTEFHQQFGAPEQLLRSALNEAEALAWQTSYPHLVFPTLALEKAQAVADWNEHQRAIRQARLAPLFHS